MSVTKGRLQAAFFAIGDQGVAVVATGRCT